MKETETSDPAPPPLLVLLPGNPGQAAFYDEFVADLRGRGFEAIVASHPCFAGAGAELHAYADHHAEQVRRYLRDSGRAIDDAQVILIGHSVGAYLAYLLVTNQLLPVGRVIMLFPFLMRPADKGRRLLRTLAVPGLMPAILWGLRRVPRALRRWLIVRAGAGDLAARVLTLLESRDAIGCVNMAVREHQEIAGRSDAGYLFHHPLFRDGRSFTALLAEGDVWAPPALAAQLPGARRLPPPVTHAFVVAAEQRRLVADAIEQWLRGDAG